MKMPNQLIPTVLVFATLTLFAPPVFSEFCDEGNYCLICPLSSCTCPNFPHNSAMCGTWQEECLMFFTVELPFSESEIPANMSSVGTQETAEVVSTDLNQGTFQDQGVRKEDLKASIRTSDSETEERD